MPDGAAFGDLAARSMLQWGLLYNPWPQIETDRDTRRNAEIQRDTEEDRDRQRQTKALSGSWPFRAPWHPARLHQQLHCGARPFVVPS